MKLTDLAPEAKWRELQQDLHDRFGLNADIMDADGHRLFGNTWGNDLCRAIRNDDKGFSSICVMAGQMFTRLLKEGEPFAEMCDAGLLRVSVPVKRDGEVIGAVGGCGLLPAEDEEVDAFTVGMMSGLDEAAIPGLASTVRTADEARIREIQDHISKRVAEITG
ncbi:PocR ligand-binding domain-containing protein [Pseudodesulfovibrio sp.]|uniref:PocR ligand-binding domain-containing protein n=1 Tax=Pseudodesulfovibrio sp. TaxID=2035812 RepID=UPI00260E945D|nr:PocR ligand-binding domain-containing protein [Pseudodesulfovibrio sp.]MDD3311380.1 PocR ligand-binding domain-containing protein [Pseudodesulfovibrio sp.]